MEKTTALTIDIILNNIEEGKIFGGFVRDMMAGIKRFQDIDLWFAEKEEADMFIQRMQDEESCSFYKAPCGEFASKDNGYPFVRDEYFLNLKTGEGFYIDVVVAPIFPVIDFEANTLVLDGSGVRRYDNDLFLFSRIIRDISERNLRLIFPSDQKKCKSVRMKKFQKLGWNIIQPDGILYLKNTDVDKYDY